MEHQVQGLTLVNNEWVSRPLDVYQIMARARGDDTEMQESTAKPTVQVPSYGILSRTILPSPLTKYILPANIRHKDLTDIVLVGDDSVQLKEIRDYGRLRHVATKSDFRGGRILAAKVFGDPREVPSISRVSSPLSKKPSMHRARRSMTGDEQYVLPPEVTVLTLSNRTLMFLWARHTQVGSVTFNQKTIRLPAGASQFDRFGAFLAIDPKRRAMAVAAQEGRLILYKTKSMETWRSEIRAGSDTIPIEDERIIAFEGRVMHMDFLASGSQLDDFHVVLLLILVHQGKTKITCFDWDCRQDLDKATARTERVSVEFEDRNPSLLIPLRRNPDFLLVFDTHISVYKDVLSGVPIRNAIRIEPSILSPLNPGDSKRRPQWVGWDKAPRNPDFAKEVFYIAREDGRVIYAERGPSGLVEVNEAGEWPYRVDTAFACLSVDSSEFSQSYPDVLIAGGAGNDGLLCRVGSWPTEYSYSLQYPGTNSITFVESMPDWTPLTDLSVTRLSSLRVPGERDRSTIFVSNGNSPHGRISELRYGLHALIDDSFSGVNGTTGLWVVDYGSRTTSIDNKHQRQHYATFIITLPPETLVIRVVRTQPESREQYSGAWEYGSWDKYQIPSGEEPIEDGVMRGEETISACPWSDRYSIQIGRHEARILHRPTLRQQALLAFETSLLLAISKPGTPFIAITYRDNGSTFLEVVRISREIEFERTRDTRYSLTHDPTCVEILDIDGVAHIFVCTFDSKVTLLRVDKLGKMFTVSASSLQDAVPDGCPILVESAVILASSGQQVLVCATRDGWLLSANISLQPDAIPRLEWQFVRMGPTSAQIRRSYTDISAAFVSCGADFCRVRCSAHTSPTLEIDSIWFTDRKHPDFMQSSVTAMCQLPFQTELDSVERNLGGFLFAVAGEQLLFSQLESDIRLTGNDDLTFAEADTRTVARSIPTGARPTNVEYLRSQRRLVVATVEAKEERQPPSGYRVLQSTLSLLRAYDEKPLDELDTKLEEESDIPDRLVVAQFSLAHAERVYSIVDWQFKNHHGKTYSLLIVGTGIHAGPGKSKGRRLIFSTGKSQSKLLLQKESTYDYPVYCVAMWNNDNTINVIGKTMSLDYFDSQAGRWTKRASIEMPSPGIHVSVNAPFVYVSTLSQSHICYEIVQRVDGPHFEQVFIDSRERACTHHVVLDIPKVDGSIGEDRIILFTDKRSSSIAGLHHPPERILKNASDIVFEACMPRTVIRLQRGDIRPPWRRPAHPTKASGNIDGILVDDLVGACSDGTIYAFSVLSEPARHLLRMLQNLIEVKRGRDPTAQDAMVKPRSGHILDVLMNGAEGAQDGNIRAHDVDPRRHERGPAGPKHKHVDGDLLVGWLDDGGDLEELLLRDTEKNVEVLFVEIALAVNGQWSVKAEGQSARSDMFMNVRGWMKQILMPIF